MPWNGIQVGDTAGAIRHYEVAGTHCVEVPRMLFERDRVEDLEDYITQVAFYPKPFRRENDYFFMFSYSCYCQRFHFLYGKKGYDKG